MEGTSLGIAENNAEVVAAIAPFAEEVRNLQSSLCESLGSLREYVLVGVESPSKDVHASPASIHSSLGFLSGVSVDLLERENAAESLNEDDSKWDDDLRPLMQPSLKRSLQMPVKFTGPRLWRPHRHLRERGQSGFLQCTATIQANVSPPVSSKAFATGEYVLQVFVRDFCLASLAWWCPHSVQSVQCTLP